MTSQRKSPEIIAIASGKGGTGKTLLAACLGYSLIRAGHAVLLVDADTATDGLSLFILGERGMSQVQGFAGENTVRGYLDGFARAQQARVEVRRIERSGAGDHGITYHMLISGKGLYGELDGESDGSPVPELGRSMFRAAIQNLFDQLHDLPFDYVIVDTRGGFAFESTDVCALADAFILVTDPDYTSFFQDRNLMRRVSSAGAELNRKPVLRSIIVNRASDGDEKPFRLELEREFGIKFTDTHAVPLDLEAMRAYKVQKIPYVVAAGSAFSYATLVAFADIFQFVTAQWAPERVERWNALVADVSRAIDARNQIVQQEEAAAAADAVERQRLQLDNEQLRAQLSQATPARRTALTSALLAGLLVAVVALYFQARPGHAPLPSKAHAELTAAAPNLPSTPSLPAPQVSAPIVQPVSELDPGPASDSPTEAARSAEAVPAARLSPGSKTAPAARANRADPKPPAKREAPRVPHPGSDPFGGRK